MGKAAVGFILLLDGRHTRRRALGQLDGRLSALAEGWRKSDISWRWSLRGVDPPPWVQGPDLSAYERKSLGLAADRLALQQGGSAPTILNAANEVAVSAFLACRIGFLDIARIVATTLESMPSTTLSELDAVYDCDRAARQKTSDIIASLSR